MAKDREQAAPAEAVAEQGPSTSKKPRGLGPLAKLAWQAPTRGLIPAARAQQSAPPQAAASAPPPAAEPAPEPTPDERSRERRRAGGRSRGSRPPANAGASQPPAAPLTASAIPADAVLMPAELLQQLRLELRALVTLCEEPPQQLSAEAEPAK